MYVFVYMCVCEYRVYRTGGEEKSWCSGRWHRGRVCSNAAAGREEGNDESYSNSIKRRAALNWN